MDLKQRFDLFLKSSNRIQNISEYFMDISLLVLRYLFHESLCIKFLHELINIRDTLIINKLKINLKRNEKALITPLPYWLHHADTQLN